MTSYDSIQNTLYAYVDSDLVNNSITVAGTTLTSQDQDVGGRYVITYSYLETASDVSTIGYYGTDPNDPEIAHFASTYHSNVEDAFEYVFTHYDASDSRVYFRDVANITFAETNISTGSTGLIAIGQVTDNHHAYKHGVADSLNGQYYDANGNPISGQFIEGNGNGPAFSTGYNPNDFEKTSDIWINSDAQYNGGSYWNRSFSGTDGSHAFKTVMEEITHSLGVDIYSEASKVNGLNPLNENSNHTYHNPLTSEMQTFDSQKYTLTSYKPAEGMVYTSTSGAEDAWLAPYTLQLFDIAALQSIYGRNYQKLSDDTTHNKASMSHTSTKALDTILYTIWDGSGNDTLDASGFSGAAKIDLRQGGFSSIGKDVNGNDAFAFTTDTSGNITAVSANIENVAIAYFAIVENATGTSQGDVIIGNAWDNTLNGGGGNDFIAGDGIAAGASFATADGQAGFHDVDMLHPDNDPSQTDTNTYMAASDDDSGNDYLLGGAGNDHLYGGAGQDILDGGADDDQLYGGTNIIGTKFAERDTADYSQLGESVTLSKFVTSSSFDFYATGNSSSDVDQLVDIEVIKASTAAGDVIDLKNINLTDVIIKSNGNPKVIEFDDGSGNGTFDSFEFQNFDKVELDGFDNNIFMSGIGGIEVDGGGTNDDDVVYLSSINDGFRQEGLVVTSSSVSNTVDGSTFSNVETFANVSYAEITALGYDYEIAGSLAANVMLNYRDYGGSLTFNIAENGSVTNGTDTDSISGLRHNTSTAATIIAGTNSGDTYNNTNLDVHIFSGTGNDTAHYVDSYFYTGGQDTIYEATDIILASNFDIGSIDVYGEGDGDLRLEFGGSNQITVKADSGNFNLYALDAVTGDYTKVYLQEYGDWGNTTYSDLSWATSGTANAPGTNGLDTILVQATLDAFPDIRGYGFDGIDTITTEVSSIRGYEIYGGKGDDTITGSNVTDNLYGGRGNDTLNGGAGDDNLFGGTGNDDFDGGAGNNDHVSYEASLNAVYVDLSQTGIANADDSYDGSTTVFNDTITNVEDVTATVFDDTLIGDASNNKLHGLQGDDTYTGNGGADTFYIGAGLDTITDFSVSGSDKISVEHVLVQGLSDLEIIHTDLGTETLAEIYVESTGEKIANVTLGVGETLGAGSLQYESYRAPDNPSGGNNTPIANAPTGELIFANNYDANHYYSTVIITPSSGISSNPAPEEISGIDWAQLEMAWANEEINEFVWFGKPYTAENFAYIHDEGYTAIRIASDSAYSVAFGSTGTGGGDSAGSVTIPAPQPVGNNNHSQFIYDASFADTSTPTTDYVTENVNAGYDTVTVKGASLSDVYLTSQGSNGDLIINFVGFPNYTINIGGNYHYGHGTDVTERIETIFFEKNGVVETLDISSGLDVSGSASADLLDGSVKHDILDALDGNDTINAGDGDDTLIGGAGTDYLVGGLGDDTYVFETGFGAGQGQLADAISENAGQGTDVVHFTGGILASDVRSWVDYGGDLYFRLGDTSNDEIVVSANYDYYEGSDIHTRLERVVFDDGTVWDLTQGLTLSDTNDAHVMYGSTIDDVIDGRGGNDTIRAGLGDDTLIGGTGTDYLVGGLGDDTYTFATGFGAGHGQLSDTVTEYVGEGTDTVHFTGGILAGEVRSWINTGGDLVFRLGDTSNDEVTIEANYDFADGSDIHTRLERVVFDDATVWDLTQGLNLSDTNDAHVMYGSTIDDVIDGRGGNDTIRAGLGDDTLIGGAGTDYLYGGLGDDTYTFATGFGAGHGQLADYVVENQNEGIDTVHFTGGILASNVRSWINTGGDLVFRLGDTSNDEVTFEANYDPANGSDIHTRLERVVFDDATVWDLTQGLTLSDTNDGHTTYGSTIDDVIDGRGGNDTIRAGLGDDTIIGGIGNDSLYGGSGDDTYSFELGFGDDYISDDSGDEVLSFGANIALNNLTFSRTGNSLNIDVSDGSSISVSNHYGTGTNAIEEIHFNDSSVIDLQEYLNTDPDAKDDAFIGDQDTNITGNLLVDNGSGADSDAENNALTVVSGTYSTTNGSVVVSANGDFTYTPTASYNGADSFTYTLEDGFTGSDTATVNLTVRPPNVAPVAQDDVFTGDQDVSITGNLLSDNGNGVDSDPDSDPLSVAAGTYSTTHGSVTIASGGSFTYTPDAAYVGSDSFTYTLQDDRGGNDTGSVSLTLNAASQGTINGTSGVDYLYGDQGGVTNDIITGFAGNDHLYGQAGGDSYIWDVGDGNDTINETGGVDQLVLHNVLESDIRIEKSGSYNLKINIGSEYITVNNQLYSDYYQSSSYDYYMVDSILLDDSTVIDLTTYSTLEGTSGNDSITGFNAATTFIGQAGNDTLYGKANGDSYVWDVGDGNDTINETGGVDQLVLHNVLESDIRIEKSGTYNLKINIGSEYITVNNQYFSDYYQSSSYDHYMADSILLDDSTVIDLTTYSTLEGTSANDSITGFNAATTFVGQAGNDTFYGKANGDTYVWDVGDGNDTINETGGVDQLVLHNVLESDIRIEKSGTYNLKINIGSEYITVNNQYFSDYYQSSSYDHYMVDSILLDDSTVIDLTTYSTLEGTSGNDSITGFNAATTFVGEAGNDTLYGKTNGDTYVWDVGDGNDTINETGGTDQLVLHNVLESDIRLEVSGTYNLKIHVGSSESITVNNQYFSDYYQGNSYDHYQVENILLDDTTTIDLLNNLTFAGTSSSEIINGLNSDDVLEGLAGNDTLNAKAGDDTLYGGDGSDYLYGNDGDDLLYGGAGVDMLYGNAGADTFLFESASAFSNSDNIQDFDLSAGDKLDVSDLLIGYDPLTDAITDFVQVTESSGSSYLNVDADGGADNFVQVAYIYNETGLTDEDALETSGNLIAA